jgi:ABC-type transporter Mla subunit MlaD
MLEHTIRSHTDCQSLLFAIETIMNQQIEQIEAVIASSGKIGDLFSVLTKLPTSIDDVIKIFKDGISKQAIDQLKASIEQAKQAIEYAIALAKIVDAINDASQRLPECFVDAPGFLSQSLKQKIDNRVENIVGPALERVSAASQLINNTIPGAVIIDTTSPENFIQSIENNPINTEYIISEYDRIFKS